MRPRLRLSRRSKSSTARSRKLDSSSLISTPRSPRRLRLRKRLSFNSPLPRRSLRLSPLTSRPMRSNSRTPRLRARRRSSKPRLSKPRRKSPLLRLQLRLSSQLLPPSPRNSLVSPPVRSSRRRKRRSRLSRRRLPRSPLRLLLPSPSFHWSRRRLLPPPLPPMAVPLEPLPPAPLPPLPALPLPPTQVSSLVLPLPVTLEEDLPLLPPPQPLTSPLKSLRSKKLPLN